MDSATRSCQGFRAILQGVMGKVNGRWGWAGQCKHRNCIGEELHLGKCWVVRGDWGGAFWMAERMVWAAAGIGVWKTCARKSAGDGAEGVT